MPDESSPPVRGVLIDLGGVLYDGHAAYAGAAAAVHKLHEAKLSVRYLTNTTRQTAADLVAKLHSLGLAVDAADLFTAPLAAKALVRARHLRPMLVIHPKLTPEFADIDQTAPNAVVIGDAGEGLHYATLNEAFRLLMAGAPLIAMARNRYFKESTGLSLDAGPFVAALEFAAGAQATVVGEPSPAFFQLGLEALGSAAREAVMIGDDVHDDLCGAAENGIPGILVRTGKYRPGDDQALPPGGRCVPDFAAAVDAILALL